VYRVLFIEVQGKEGVPISMDVKRFGCPAGEAELLAAELVYTTVSPSDLCLVEAFGEQDLLDSAASNDAAGALAEYDGSIEWAAV